MLSDPSSKLFGSLDDVFPLPYEQIFSGEQPRAIGHSCPKGGFQGHYLNRLGREQLDDATFQVSML